MDFICLVDGLYEVIKVKLEFCIDFFDVICDVFLREWVGLVCIILKIKIDDVGGVDFKLL